MHMSNFGLCVCARVCVLHVLESVMDSATDDLWLASRKGWMSCVDIEYPGVARRSNELNDDWSRMCFPI